MQKQDDEILTLGTVPLSLEAVLDQELYKKSAREAAHDAAWEAWSETADPDLVRRVAGRYYAESRVAGAILLVTLTVEAADLYL